MHVLQLTSDWKWTGPAEPMLSLGLALRERGTRVSFAFPEAPPDAPQSLSARAAERGVTSALVLGRRRGLRPLADRRDVARLAALFRDDAPELVHCWHTRDHLLALRARGRAPGPVIVRSVRRAEAPAATPWTRWLLGPGCEGLLCVSPGSAARIRPLRGRRPTWGRLGSVDLERFRPGSAPAALREALGLRPEHRVIGIVARAQRHRRFDLLLDAAATLFARRPEARLLVVGRGTRQHEVVETPARRLGIRDRVHLAGYREGDFVDVLRACDVFTFLVPGSDGHCRALLEALACGLPAVVSGRGALPEILGDAGCGSVVEESVPALAEAWERLLVDEIARARAGRAARARAEAAFRPEDFATELLGFYDEVVSASLWSATRSR